METYTKLRLVHELIRVMRALVALVREIIELVGMAINYLQEPPIGQMDSSIRAQTWHLGLRAGRRVT